MAMTEYNVYDTLWEDEANSANYWQNRTDQYDSSTLNWDYRPAKFERGRWIPQWTEV